MSEYAATTALKIEKSLCESRWVFPQADIRAVERLMQVHDLPEFIARMLVQRGVTSDDVNEFLFPTLRDHFPDPFSMAGMEQFAHYMNESLRAGRKIGVFADFDVDGATSAAILIRFFRALGQNVPVYIPDRLNEGYGPSGEALAKLKEQGAEIILMADCGITAHEAVQQGRDMGLDIVIFDHHEPEEGLPNATFVIDPKRPDDKSGLDMLAACGVCFMACVAMNKVLRESGYFTEQNIEEPPLKSWIDLVGLGTVCDMVPLTGVNRLFVRTGFQQMAFFNNPGIQALCEIGKIDKAPEPMHAGFVIGPRINAGSRVHRSDLGAALLSTDDIEEARSIAWTLEKCNEERKTIQSTMNREAIEKVQAQGLEDDPVIVVDDASWHPGLSGLVAGRLKDRFGKPAIVVTYATMPDGTIEGRGSGRSVPGISMAQAFIDARNEGILIKGGGHAMAGGFTIAPDRLNDFKSFLIKNIKKQSEHIDLTKETIVDSIASVRGAQVSFVRLLQDNVGPFGVGNAQPLFALANVRVHQVDVMKEKHLRVQVSDWEGGTRMKAVLFSGVGTPLGDMLLKHHNQPFHLVGQFQINSWQGRESVEFLLSDGALAMEEARVDIIESVSAA